MHHPRGKISTQQRECIIFSITVFPPAESTALSVVRRFFLRHFKGLSRRGKQHQETNKQPPGPSYVCGNRFSVLFGGHVARVYSYVRRVRGLVFSSNESPRTLNLRLIQSEADDATTPDAIKCVQRRAYMQLFPSSCFGKRMRRDLLCGSISFLCALDEFPEC